MLMKAETVCSRHQLHLTKAKLILIRVSLNLHLGDIDQVQLSIEEAHKIIESEMEENTKKSDYLFGNHYQNKCQSWIGNVHFLHGLFKQK